MADLSINDAFKRLNWPPGHIGVVLADPEAEARMRHAAWDAHEAAQRQVGSAEWRERGAPNVGVIRGVAETLWLWLRHSMPGCESLTWGQVNAGSLAEEVTLDAARAVAAKCSGDAARIAELEAENARLKLCAAPDEKQTATWLSDRGWFVLPPAADDPKAFPHRALKDWNTKR